MIVELLLGAGALGVTASGWIYAFRARGESRDAVVDLNRAFDRERKAGVDRDAANTRAGEFEAKAKAAEIQRNAAITESRGLRAELDAARRERTVLYEKLAAAGVAVGDVVFDLAVDRLYADEARRPAGPGGGEGPLPGGGDDPPAVPADPATPPKPTGESG